MNQVITEDSKSKAKHEVITAEINGRTVYKTRWGWSPVRYTDYLKLKALHKSLWQNWVDYVQTCRSTDGGWSQRKEVASGKEAVIRQYYGDGESPCKDAVNVGEDSTGKWWEVPSTRYPGETCKTPFICPTFTPEAPALIHAFRVSRQAYENPSDVEFPTINSRIWRRMYRQLQATTPSS